MIDKLKAYIRGRYNISFSKAGDDIQLMKLINQPNPGTYVDVGSWHPYKASNSYYFYLRNWKGICIDPNPELIELYKKFRPKDNFINAGIGGSNQTLDYFMFEESSMNTFSNDFYEKHKMHSKLVQKIEIPLFSLKDILDENLDINDRLDFFDIDVEGFDLEVLKTNDWNKFRPKVIVVESDFSLKNDLDSDITNYIQNQDYRLIGKSVINGDLGNLFFMIK